MSSDPSKSAPVEPIEEGINAIINRTHEQTRQLFSGLRLVRDRANSVGVPEDEHAIDLMFERIVRRLEDSKLIK